MTLLFMVPSVWLIREESLKKSQLNPSTINLRRIPDAPDHHSRGFHKVCTLPLYMLNLHRVGTPGVMRQTIDISCPILENHFKTFPRLVRLSALVIHYEVRFKPLSESFAGACLPSKQLWYGCVEKGSTEFIHRLLILLQCHGFVRRMPLIFAFHQFSILLMIKDVSVGRG